MSSKAAADGGSSGGGAAAAVYPHSCSVDVPVEKREHGEFIRNALAVDKKLQPDKIAMAYEVGNASLRIIVSATSARMLRVGLSSAMDMTLVCVKTLAEFAE